MRIPMGYNNAQNGGNYGYGGNFNTSPPNGLDGNNGVIAYSQDGGSTWSYVYYTGTDVQLTI